MIGLTRLMLGASAAALTIGALSVAAPAVAQTTETASSLEEVVVTARRREENLQSVPISVTAVTGKTIEKQGILDFTSLSRQVPNVNIAGGSTNPQLLTVGIRGIRQKESQILFDPSVNVFFAEAVATRTYGIGEEMFDLSNIQILKGPQGTLFGRNSVGGALVITPNYASISEGFGGSVSASFGDYSRKKFNAVLNMPLNDTLALRVAGEWFHRDGYITNVINGDDWYDRNNRAFRVSLTWQPTDTFRNYTTGTFFHQFNAPNSIALVDFLPGGSGNLLGGPAAVQALLADQRQMGVWKTASYAGAGGPRDFFNALRCAPGSSTPFQLVCNPADFHHTNRETVWSLTNRSELEIGSATLKNILSYRWITRDSFQSSWSGIFANGAGGSGNQAITGSPGDIETVTEELQLSGPALDDRLKYTTGVWVLRDIAQERNISFQAIGAGTTNTHNYADSRLRGTSWGVYGQGTYSVTDRLNLTGGIRYNSDHKTVRQGNLNIDAVTGARSCNLFVGSTRLPATDQQCILFGDKKWHAVTWTASADYKLVDDTMLYAMASRGYRGGSFFPRAIRDTLFAYNPEFILSYEAGIKSEWRVAGRPLRANLSVYRAKVTDMQVQVQDVTTSPLSGFIANAGAARYHGFEFESTFRPTDALTLNGYVSYSKFKYTEYFDGPTDLSYQSAPQPISPWSAGLTADYHIDLTGDSGLDLRADMAWTGKVETDNRFPNLKGDWAGPSYTIGNLRADWTHAFGQPLTVSAWVTNVFDKVYNAGGTCLSGICYIVPSPPRMWGVDFRYEF